MKLTVSIIIVSYNSLKFIEKCLNSILSLQQGYSLEVIVVDNHSSDGSQDKILNFFPRVHLIKNDTNLGFAKACNQGLKAAKSDYILFLNPDTIIIEDAISKCVNFFHLNPDIGLMGCKLLNPDGTLQPSCSDFPYLLQLILDQIFRFPLFPSSIKEKLLIRYWTHDETREVDWLIGAFMLIKRELIDHFGGFDEDFFLYGEDLDLCYRIKMTGRKVVFFHDAQIIHIGHPRLNPEKLKKHYKAILLFYRKHYTGLKVYLLKLFMILVLWLRGQKDLMRFVIKQ